MSSREIVNALNEVEAAITDGTSEQIDAAFDELEAAYDGVAVEETTRRERAGTARTGDLPLNQHETLGRYLQRRVQTGLARSSIFQVADAYAFAPERVNDDEQVENVRALAERESKLLSVAGDADPILEATDLPPKLAVLSFEPTNSSQLVGEVVEVQSEIRNVGDAAASGVAVSVESNISFESTSASIGELAPDETVTVSFRTAPSDSGDAMAKMTLESENAETVRETTRFRVLSKTDLATAADGTLQEMLARIESADDLQKGVAKSLTAKLDSARDSIDRAKTFANGGKAKQTNKQFTTAINRVGAFLNSLDAQSKKSETSDASKGEKGNRTNSGTGSKVSDALAYSLARQAELAIDQLDRARSASIA